MNISPKTNIAVQAQKKTLHKKANMQELGTILSDPHLFLGEEKKNSVPSASSAMVVGVSDSDMDTSD